MYVVDARDQVIELRDVPIMDPGAPNPAVVAAEQVLDLIYLVSEPDPNWDGTYVHVVGPESADRLVARIGFAEPCAHIFGPPNDEAFAGHPLAGRGLGPYRAWEVRASSWIRSLERMNAVHPQHRPGLYAGLRHFIFTFHDSTFECVAKSYQLHLERGSIISVASRLPATWA